MSRPEPPLDGDLGGDAGRVDAQLHLAEMHSDISPVMEALEQEDVLAEILARLPPRPSSFPRASAVAKRWGLVAASSALHRRFRDHHHRRPPVLGVFERHARTLLFTPVLDAPDRVPAERFSLQLFNDKAKKYWNWTVAGCRHGRVLVINRTPCELIVFDPISGDRRLVEFPPDFVEHAYSANGAVVGDEQGHSSAFQLVLVGFSAADSGAGTGARIYCSETSKWGELISMPEPCALSRLPWTLVGKRLYWWLTEPDHGIMELNLDNRSLAVLSRPPIANIHRRGSRIIRAEDDGVGLAVFSYPSFQLWDRNVSGQGVATWVLRETVDMHAILALPSWMEPGTSTILGYAEDAHVTIISVHYGGYVYVFLLQLDSMQCKQLHGNFTENLYHLYTNFYAGPAALRLLPRLDNDRAAVVPQA